MAAGGAALAAPLHANTAAAQHRTGRRFIHIPRAKNAGAFEPGKTPCYPIATESCQDCIFHAPRVASPDPCRRLCRPSLQGKDMKNDMPPQAAHPVSRNRSFLTVALIELWERFG